MPKKKTNFQPALEKGKKEFLDMWNTEEAKHKLPELCGCTIEDGSVRLRYFNTLCSVTVPECSVRPADLKLYEQILLLHYLARPVSYDGPLPTRREEQKWITFKQLPNAEFYNATYQKRGPNIILSAFAKRPALLVKAGEAMGGTHGNYGDYSVVVSPLPRIDAMAVLYAGDDELPPAAEILFPADIHRYLPLEDTAVLSGIIAVRLMKAAEGGAD
jgi:hypothetical protein